MSVASLKDGSNSGKEAMHEPSPAMFKSTWDRPDEELGSCDGHEQEQSRIESLLESLSSVDSLTIMSPKSSTSEALAPELSAIDSLMQVNKVFNDDQLPMSSESIDIDSGVISRQLKPIRTRSHMGSSVTAASSSQEISARMDGSLSHHSCSANRKQRPASTIRASNSSKRHTFTPCSQQSSPEAVQKQPHMDASHRASKPPRFGERLQDTGRTAGHHMPSRSRDSRDCLRGQNSSPSEIEGFNSIPTSPETKPESSNGSGRNFVTPRHDFSPRGWNAPDHDPPQEASTIEQQTQVLYACIHAMEAELQAHMHELQCSPHEPPQPCVPGPVSAPAASKGPPTPLSSSPQVHPLSTPEALEKAQSAGHSVVMTGGQTHALASSGQAWPIQSYQPQQYNPYQVPPPAPIQHWGMNWGANFPSAQKGALPPHSKSSKRSAKAPSSCGTNSGSKHSSKSIKRQAKARTPAASAKGEGVVGSSSDDIFAAGMQPKEDSQQKPKIVATGGLQKGQTTAISRVLNEEEEAEVAVAGGCLGQFWGTNRQVKKKKEMPRAPQITAPVVAQGGEGLGVKLGCW